MTKVHGVYIFHGAGARFATAVYETVEQATADIARHGMSGVLTWYPVGKTDYNHVVDEGLFAAKDHADGKFVQSFTSAFLDHYHFEDGKTDCS